MASPLKDRQARAGISLKAPKTRTATATIPKISSGVQRRLCQISAWHWARPRSRQSTSMILKMSREVLALADIDLDVLLSDPESVQIIGRAGRGKLLYHVPEGFECCTVKLTYGEKGKDERAIFELRFQASNGHTVQDVLPPSE